ncbi:MAG: LpxD N-terminal domain-containing protein, partial [Planctomycetota bacterium]
MRPAPEQVLEALGSAGALCHLLAAKAPDLQPELAGHAGAPVRGFESIDQARDGDLTFVRSPDYAARWADSKATVVLVTRGVELEPGDGRAVITVASADAAVATLLGMLAEHAPSEPAPQGKHPTAAVHETATVPESASIGAHATIGPGATLGERTQVHSGATVGAGVVVGHDCVVHPGARLLPGTRIGDRTQILANAVIGADGFGFTTHPATGVPIRIPHLAGVSIGSDCEIGAGSCVDRGKLRD